MVKLILTLSITACCFAVASASGNFESPFQGAQRPDRSIRIGKQNVYKIDAATEIVVDEKASKVTQYAASELHKYLKEALGTEIAVVKKPSPDKTSLIIGVSPWSKQAKIDDAKLCRDAFIIKSNGKDIYILGRDDAEVNPERSLNRLYERGSLFGVYDFLERFAKVRFYFPGKGVVVPRHSSLNIPELDIYDRPDYEARDADVISGSWHDDSPETRKRTAVYPWYGNSPQKNEYYNYLRFQTMRVPCCHGLNEMNYIQRFGKSHPEYFAMIKDGRRSNDLRMRYPGQLCFSSGIKDEMIRDAEAFFTDTKPALRGLGRWPYAWKQGADNLVFDAMPQDAMGECYCKECLAYMGDDTRDSDQGRKKIGERTWTITSAIARNLKQKNIKGYISQMAYIPNERVPDVNIPDNVLVMVAVKGPWAQGEYMRNDNQLIVDWVKKTGRKVWLWNYVSGFARQLSFPTSTPRRIAKYYKSQSDKIYGMYMQSPAPKLIFNYLNYYILSQVAWNNKADVDALLDEHAQVMFGKAAPVMAKFFDRLEELWFSMYEDALGDNLGPTRMKLPTEHEIWSKFFSQMELKRMNKDFDQAEKLSSENPAALERVKYIRQEMFDPICDSYRIYWEKNNSINAFKAFIPPVSDDEKILNADSTFNAGFWEKRPVLYLQALHNPADGDVQTRVKLARDSKNLYILFDCEEPEIDKIVASKHPKNDIRLTSENCVEVFLNPSGNRKDYYHIMLNSKGSIADYAYKYVNDKKQTRADWDSQAKVVIIKNKSNWEAEITVPLKALDDMREDSIVANFTRNRVVGAVSRLYTWGPFFLNSFHDVENYGTIVFADDKSKNIVKDANFDVKKSGRRNYGAWLGPYKDIVDTQISIDKHVFVRGPSSIKLKSWNKDGDDVHILQRLKLKPDTVYKLSYYVKTRDVVPVKYYGGVCIKLWTGKNHWFPSPRITGTHNWFLQSFTFKTGSNIDDERTFITPMVSAATGEAWFDQIILEEMLPQTEIGI